jgi:hypothetical protein
MRRDGVDDPKSAAKILNLDELNAWLLDKCIAYAKAHRHPELVEQTVWEVFEAERPKLVPYAGRFDGFHAGVGLEDLSGALSTPKIRILLTGIVLCFRRGMPRRCSTRRWPRLALSRNPEL